MTRWKESQDPRLNTAGETCLELADEVVSDTETMLATAGAIVVREPIEEQAKNIFCF